MEKRRGLAHSKSFAKHGRGDQSGAKRPLNHKLWPSFLCLAPFITGRAGRLTKVLEQAEKCIVLCDEHGMSHERESVGVAYFDFNLTVPRGTSRRLCKALDTVTKGLDFVTAHGEPHYEAELYRLKGELLLAQAANNENLQADSREVAAEASFHHAIEIARRQNAKSWELRGHAKPGPTAAKTW